MKKKIAALLTAALVMTMSASTVFAAASPDWSNMNNKTEIVNNSTTGLSDGASVTVSSATNFDSTERDAVNVELDKILPANAKDVEVKAVVELNLSGTITGTNGATVKVKVDGINAGDKVKVLHYVNNAWQKEAASVDNDGNVIISGLRSFSPFVFVKYTETASNNPGPDNGNGNGNGNGSGSGSNYTVAVQSSPKTGVVPFAAMAAGICLAGAAVCGKKVKFN